jgi:hypothetical protein
MNNIPLAFKSPLLAQARLLGLSDPTDLEFVTNRDKLEDNNPCKNNMSTNTLTRFKSSSSELAHNNSDLPAESIVELFERKAKSSRNKMFFSQRGQSLLCTALRYNIPVNEEDVDWLSLIDEIDEYEALMQRGRELNIEWDYDYYDPVGLEQAIIDHEEEDQIEKAQLYSDFYLTRGVEV